MAFLDFITGKKEAQQALTPFLPQDIYEAAGRLSRLNQFLLLITKIENLQFSKTSDIDITNIIDKYLSNLDEIIEAKNITIQKNYSLTRQLNINPTLAEVLVSNLLSNAIKHNIKNGLINIK